MTSILQIEANRRNSQKSTGPRTLAGKAVSSMNALKSGIDAKSQVIRGEDPAALQLLTDQYYESLKPQRPEEMVVVDAVIAADWLLRRLRKTEAQMWDDAFQAQEQYEEYHDEPEQEYRLATAFKDRGGTFTRLQRRLDSAERSLYRAFAELRRLRDNRPNPDPPPADFAPPPIAVTPSPVATKNQIGFVPSTPLEPVAEAGSPVFSAPVSASPRLRVERLPPLAIHSVSNLPSLAM